jgi:hypothetical protein
LVCWERCMPIKYNLTKYDILAEKFHDLAQKKGTLDKDEEITKAGATIIVSFSPAHSWQTSKAIIEGNINAFNSSEVKNEYKLASEKKWKLVRNTDIQEVSCINIRDNLFSTWLLTNIPEKNTRETYRKAWCVLKEQFNEECDGIRVQRA